MRICILVCLLAMGAAACGGGDAASDSVTTTTTLSSNSTSTTAASTTTQSSSTDETTTTAGTVDVAAGTGRVSVGDQTFTFEIEECSSVGNLTGFISESEVLEVAVSYTGGGFATVGVQAEIDGQTRIWTAPAAEASLEGKRIEASGAVNELPVGSSAPQPLALVAECP